MWRLAERMRRHSIPGFQQHRGLGDQKVVPDLIAVREVSDRELSDGIALGNACDFCARERGRSPTTRVQIARGVHGFFACRLGG